MTGIRYTGHQRRKAYRASAASSRHIFREVRKEKCRKISIHAPPRRPCCPPTSLLLPGNDSVKDDAHPKRRRVSPAATSPPALSAVLFCGLRLESFASSFLVCLDIFVLVFMFSPVCVFVLPSFKAKFSLQTSPVSPCGESKVTGTFIVWQNEDHAN